MDAIRRCGSVVLPQWVIASVLCGRALPTELYSTRVQLPLRGLLISLALLDKSRVRPHLLQQQARCVIG